MRIDFIWISLLFLPFGVMHTKPIQVHHKENKDDYKETKRGATPEIQNEQVISVRITSSVAVGRGKGKTNILPENKQLPHTNITIPPTLNTQITNSTNPTTIEDIEDENVTDVMIKYAGANIDFIKQLQARKETRGLNNFEQVNPFESDIKQFNYSISEEYTTEFYDKSVTDVEATASETDETVENVPMGRSISSLSAKKYIQTLTHESLFERDRNTRVTTVSFNIVHDIPKHFSTYEHQNNSFGQNKSFHNAHLKVYSEPAQVYSEPAKFYSEPAKFYSEPAKVYSEPAKVYSEPAKVYSKPAKVYSEPAKVYSEPAKFYSQPASLHLTPEPLPNHTPWRPRSQTTPVTSSTNEADISTTPITTIDYKGITQAYIEQQPEKNYEVDEKISVMTEGRSHGVQKPNNENCKQENCKVGYVVEGRQYKKYRVEERTPDGFIVGEYGVVRNEDGALRGVRYTADSEASPRLIQDALMKFLQLK
ncbi:unnamed protein product [Parnassius apollo]|uniref:(apollo) hypothetical protein n=1 Tax=Parnassius apollo TaxID=110799 RepID=A0A8S3WTM8_PARAO|nr:unnamed protein product [Parnassius apollo]